MDTLKWSNDDGNFAFGICGEDKIAQIQKFEGQWNWSVRQLYVMDRPNHGRVADRKAAEREAASFWHDQHALAGEGCNLRWTNPAPGTWFGFSGDLLVGSVILLRITREQVLSSGVAGTFELTINPTGEGPGPGGIKGETDTAYQARNIIERYWSKWLAIAGLDPAPFARPGRPDDNAPNKEAA